MNSANSYDFLRLQLERIQAQGGSAQDSAECAQRFLEMARQAYGAPVLPAATSMQHFSRQSRKLGNLKLV